MKKVILTIAALGLAALMVTDVQAYSWAGRRLRGGGRGCGYAQPAPVTVQAANTTQAGVRAFSYQPVPAAPVRAYPTYRGGYTGKAYENAINKSLGRY
jgi:hypothetical protein